MRCTIGIRKRQRLSSAGLCLSDNIGTIETFINRHPLHICHRVDVHAFCYRLNDLSVDDAMLRQLVEGGEFRRGMWNVLWCSSSFGLLSEAWIG